MWTWPTKKTHRLDRAQPPREQERGHGPAHLAGDSSSPPLSHFQAWGLGPPLSHFQAWRGP